MARRLLDARTKLLVGALILVEVAIVVFNFVPLDQHTTEGHLLDMAGAFLLMVGLTLVLVLLTRLVRHGRPGAVDRREARWIAVPVLVYSTIGILLSLTYNLYDVDLLSHSFDRFTEFRILHCLIILSGQVTAPTRSTVKASSPSCQANSPVNTCAMC